MSPAELEAYAEVMQRKGILRATINGNSIEMSPIALNIGAVVPTGAQPIGLDKLAPTEDELMFWSAPDGAPSLRAERPE